MKLITQILSKVYQYATALIVVAAPLFFIPKTGFTGDVTYHIAMMILIAVALLAYVGNALITRTWHTISKLEFISYYFFSLAVIASTLFSPKPSVTLFGEGFNQYSGVAFLTLPIVMYLVRALPESLRHKLKYAIIAILGVSSFVFVSALMLGGKVLEYTRVLFSGFTSPVSFAAYIGLFSLACFFYVKKGGMKKRYKVFVLITGLLFIAWLVSLSATNSVRPNLTSTLLVGKKVLMQDSIFGIGAGNFTRAWQLYRPQNVVLSPYFGYDFNQGSDTVSTLFVTLGLVGLLAFMLLVVTAVYSTIISYTQNKEGEEHYILGLLALALLYFIGVSLLVPLSYAMLVMWMVVAGLGLAKARLTEFHPSKKISYLLIPVAALLLVNAVVTINKSRAFALYNQAQTATKVEDAEALVNQAATIYTFDGFYRVLVEYAIISNRNLAQTATTDQEAFKTAYLTKAQAAVNYALKAVELNPSNYQNYVSLGRAYELAVPFDKENGYARAKDAYANAIKLFPDNPYLYLMQARLETSAGTKEGVRTQLTEALKKKQNFADALYLMSQLEASESKIDEAIAYAIEAIKSAPEDPLTYIQAGLLFYGKKDYQNAVLALRTALEKDQNNATIAYFLALSLRDGGRPDLAKPLADELLKRNPGNADIQRLVDSINAAIASATKADTTAKK